MLALGQAAANDTQAFELGPELHRPVGHGAVLGQDQNELLAQVRADRHVLDQHGVVGGAADQLQARVQTGVKLPSRLSNTARPRMVPVRGSTWLSMKFMWPRCG